LLYAEDQAPTFRRMYVNVRRPVLQASARCYRQPWFFQNQ